MADARLPGPSDVPFDVRDSGRVNAGALSRPLSPARSCGPLGWNDAADPDALACMPGDTPGSLGQGGDAASLMCTDQPAACEMEVPVVEVDLDRMRHLLYAVAYAEAADRAATHGFASSEIDLGDQARIESAARQGAARLVDDLRVAIETGPHAIAAFVEEQERRRQRARTSLKNKLDAALRAGQRWTDALGWSIKALSAMKFASTVTVKTLALFTGGAGTAVDFAYSGAKAGVDQWLSGEKGKTVQGVVVTETAENFAQELAETLNEFVADGLMTRAERNQFEGAIGNFKGDYGKLTEQIAKLEARLQKALKSGRGGGKYFAKLLEKRAKKLAKLKALPLRTVKTLAKKGVSGVAKKAAGHTLSLVFLASEVMDAWSEAREEWRASN